MAYVVLGTAPMLRPVIALGLVMASVGSASAGKYVGLGIGTSPATSGEMDLDEGGRSGRLQLGFAFGRLAVEGLLGRATLMGRQNAYGEGREVTWTSLGVAGKLNIPLQDRFEVFGRLGMQRTWLRGPQDSTDRSGDGLFGGAGVEYKIDIGLAGGSIFMDYTIARAALTADDVPDMTERTMTSRTWALGATLSF